VQAVASPGEIERNAGTATRLIDEASASGAALIVFPELFLCCYDLALLRRDPSRCDIEADDARLDPIREACRTGAITAVLSGSVLTQDSRSRTLSALVVDEHGGLSARYDKQHLWRDEQPFFEPGTQACIVDVQGWQLGLGICYDAAFPEHARAAALAGADGWNRDGHSPIARIRRRNHVTLIWFIVWVIANNVGDHEPLLTDPVNVWTWTLVLAVALDLSRQHAPGFGKPGRAPRGE
jgi:predicted amidohydrolase